MLLTPNPAMQKCILVDPGGYHCLNMGDVAMMSVAVARLKELWPYAEIEVVTSRPDLLSRYCPSAAPISADERNAWLSGQSLIGGLHRKLPEGISAHLLRLERALWLHCAPVTDIGVRLKAVIRRRPSPSPSGFRNRLDRAGLFVVSGMGVLNDAFGDIAGPLLDELEAALQAGIPVIAFGQGIGPITDPVLLAKVRAVLPRLKLIGLREGHTGVPLLLSLGVPRESIYVTGDDAIALAYLSHPASLGNAIGINLRLANYAGTGTDIAGILREPLWRAVKELKSTMVSVPITFHQSDSDVVSIGRIFGDRSPGSEAQIECPEDVIRQIGKCRIVVTGSYHGGLFALAQGIPVVGLLQSGYYEQKFRGLKEQFPGGCRMLDFRRQVTASQIEDTIRDAWESAEKVRDPLLKAAAHQVELSRDAYQRAHKLVPLMDE